MERKVLHVDQFLTRLVGEDIIPLDTRRVLDIGCGKGIVGATVRATRPLERLVGVDAFGPYLKYLSEYGPYDELVKHDLCQTPLPFKSGEFDVVLALEVLEHLLKGDALEVLSEAERVGRRVIASVPDGFLPQGPFDGNPYQVHRSEWSASDFVSRGYQLLHYVRVGYRVRLDCTTRNQHLARIIQRIGRANHYAIIAVRDNGSEDTTVCQEKVR